MGLFAEKGWAAIKVRNEHHWATQGQPVSRGRLSSRLWVCPVCQGFASLQFVDRRPSVRFQVSACGAIGAPRRLSPSDDPVSPGYFESYLFFGFLVNSGCFLWVRKFVTVGQSCGFWRVTLKHCHWRYNSDSFWQSISEFHIVGRSRWLQVNRLENVQVWSLAVNAKKKKGKERGDVLLSSGV